VKPEAPKHAHAFKVIEKFKERIVKLVNFGDALDVMPIQKFALNAEAIEFLFLHAIVLQRCLKSQEKRIVRSVANLAMNASILRKTVLGAALDKKIRHYAPVHFLTSTMIN